MSGMGAGEHLDAAELYLKTAEDRAAAGHTDSDRAAAIQAAIAHAAIARAIVAHNRYMDDLAREGP